MSLGDVAEFFSLATCSQLQKNFLNSLSPTFTACLSPFFVSADGWIFNVATLEWRKAPITEECRMWHTACRDAWDDILIFGGCSTNIFVNEVRFDGFFTNFRCKCYYKPIAGCLRNRYVL